MQRYDNPQIATRAIAAKLDLAIGPGEPTWSRRLSEADGTIMFVTQHTNAGRMRDRGPHEPSPVEVHEALFTFPNGPEVRLVGPSRESLLRTGARMDAHFGNLRPAPASPTPSDMQPLLSAVDDAMDNLLVLLDGHDALDVMVMVRQYVMPFDLGLWAESESSLLDSWACGEVVALALLGLGLPDRSPDCQVPTASVIPELVQVAATIVQLAVYASLTQQSEPPIQDLETPGAGKLAKMLCSHELTVRGRQYESVATTINEAILRTPQSDKGFRSGVGFTYDDVISVREALIECMPEGLESELEIAGYLGARQEPCQEAIEAARAWFETPSKRYLVTIGQIAQQGGLDLALVEKVLGIFSLGPTGQPSRDLLRAFVNGRNALAGKAILHSPGRGYLPLPGAIALDEIRRTCEAHIKSTKAWTSYGRARDAAAETLAIDTLAEMLDGQARVYRNLRYRGPADGVDLSAGATDVSLAPLVEADALLLVDGVAMCVEIKAGALRPRTRQGGVPQLDGDLAKTVKEADFQADRLRGLITAHRGIWLESGSWLDLEDVQEAHTLVVCLDDFGPLSVAMAEMVEGGILAHTQLPWVVTIHDLLVAREVFDRPEHFLTYLRRRTNRDAALWVTGVDELDVIMWFVAGGFYFVPDPDRLHARYPFEARPSKAIRREYAEQGRTIVGTFTDPLDAYFYWAEGISSQPAECPHRAAMPARLQRLVDTMREVHAPGWLRLASDLDGYAAQAQDDIAQYIEQGIAMTERDHQMHTYAIRGCDDTGRWIHIFATGSNSDSNRQRLQQYLRAKKHQERADRAFGVLLNQRGEPMVTLWLAHEPEEDRELTELARQMQLRPPGFSSVPATVKRRRKSSRRRRRR